MAIYEIPSISSRQHVSSRGKVNSHEKISSQLEVSHSCTMLTVRNTTISSLPCISPSVTLTVMQRYIGSVGCSQDERILAILPDA